MDFSKLNTEFANMQISIIKYNKVINKIESRIRNNLKIINKYESRSKKGNEIEKELDILYVKLLKNENNFLSNLVNDKSVDKEEAK